MDPKKSLYKLFLVCLVVFLYFIGKSIGQLEFVHAFFLKATLSLGVRSLLLKVGCSSTLAIVIGFALRTTIHGLDAESIKMMTSSGSSGSDSGNWKNYLNFQEYGDKASSSTQNRGPVQEPSGVQEQPQPRPAPAESNSSTWSGSWISRWLNQAEEASAEATSQPREVPEPASLL